MKNICGHCCIRKTKKSGLKSSETRLTDERDVLVRIFNQSVVQLKFDRNNTVESLRNRVCQTIGVNQQHYFNLSTRNETLDKKGRLAHLESKFLDLDKTLKSQRVKNLSLKCSEGQNWRFSGVEESILNNEANSMRKFSTIDKNGRKSSFDIIFLDLKLFVLPDSLENEITCEKTRDLMFWSAQDFLMSSETCQEMPSLNLQNALTLAALFLIAENKEPTKTKPFINPSSLISPHIFSKHEHNIRRDSHHWPQRIFEIYNALKAKKYEPTKAKNIYTTAVFNLLAQNTNSLRKFPITDSMPMNYWTNLGNAQFGEKKSKILLSLGPGGTLKIDDGANGLPFTYFKWDEIENVRIKKRKIILHTKDNTKLKIIVKSAKRAEFVYKSWQISEILAEKRKNEDDFVIDLNKTYQNGPELSSDTNIRRKSSVSTEKINKLQNENETLANENRKLSQRLEDLEAKQNKEKGDTSHSAASLKSESQESDTNSEAKTQILEEKIESENFDNIAKRLDDTLQLKQSRSAVLMSINSLEKIKRINSF